MKIKIEKAIAKGKIQAPPSKSYAHRLLICGALAEGQSKIEGISQSKDMEATLNCIKALGVEFTKTGDTVFINGGIKEANGNLNCYESGSTLRFFIPISLLGGHKRRFVGTERLMERGIQVYKDAFDSKGITFDYENDALVVKGTLKSGVFSLPGDVSSQFVSGLLFALPLLSGDSEIRLTSKLQSEPYVDITIDCLSKFGIEIIKEKSSYFIRGNQKYKCSDQVVEGDYSNAAFLDGFNLLGGDVSVFGLNDSSLQGDRIYKKYYELLQGGTPIIDISSCPDLGPVLFALASVQNGATFTGTKRLKIKESDRCEAMKRELSKLGVNVEIFDDSVTVSGRARSPQEELYGHNDHRIVMALSLLLTKFGGVINGCEAVQKSYPNFFEDMAKLRIGSEILSENYK